MQQSLLQDSVVNPDESENHIQELSPAEHLIDQINGQGRYQIQSFVIFSLMWFLTSWLLLGIGFFFDNDFTCAKEEYSDHQACKAYVCGLSDELRNDEIATHASSIVFEFDTYLICPNHQTQVSLLQAMLFIGAIFGFFVIPYMADNYGRKLAMRIAWGTGTVAVMIICIADSSNMIGLGLFLIGFGANPAITLCFSFINEICLGKSRARYGIGVQVTWAFGQITIALIFATTLTWLEIAYIILVLFIVEFVLIFLYLEETPMFMLKKNSQRALEILNIMAKTNKRQPLTLQAVDRIEKQCEEEFFEEQISLGFSDLFRYKSIRWTSISAAVILFGIQVMYYSSQLNGNSVGFTRTVNQVIFGVSQMAGYLMVQFIIDKCKRKRATLFGMGISAILSLVLGFLITIQTADNQSALKWVETIILMINRFILCGFWSIYYVYVAELYPTEIRSLGFGWTSVVGQIGSTVSPFVTEISEAIGMNSWFLTAFFGAGAWCFIFCLHETLGTPLQEVILERMDTLRKEKSELEIEQSDDDDDYRSLPDINKLKALEDDFIETNLPKSSPVLKVKSAITL